MLKIVFLLSLTILPYTVHCSFIFDWLGWSDSKGPNLTYKGVPLLQIPFEELSSEDKFLVEASKIVGFELSELDACQHRIYFLIQIVMKLKSSCGSLSEEDLAKFSVNLLNCQSAVEGRQEFPCEEKMSLKECTKEMNAETWNAYHIMNNRARAVCYASRQQQFRALAELTVNKLVSTAHTHIEALSALQKESDNLKGGASLTLNQIQKSQQDVLSRQRSLASISMVLGEEIQRSLAAASDQKQMLIDFRKGLTNLFTKLQTKLDDAEKQVGESTGSVKTSHADLMKDMKEISNIASQILKEVDDSSKKVVENNDVALEQFKAALENMKEINLSIGYILSVVETIKQRSSLISDIVGEKGENIELFVVVAIHSLCLVVAMVVSSFLSAPWTSRLALLAASSLNIYSNIALLTQTNTDHPRVGLIQFYIGFTSIALCDWLIRIVIKMVMNRKSSTDDKKVVSSNFEEFKENHVALNGGGRVLDSTRLIDSTTLPNSSLLNNHYSSNFHETPARSRVNNWLSENRYDNNARIRPTNINAYVRDTNTEEDDTHSLISSAARSISGRSVDARSACTAISKHTGQRCRKKAMKSSNFCNLHDR